MRTYYAIMRVLPFSLKYRFGRLLRASRPPYKLVSGKTVVQVGAPRDTLQAGRSRGFFFSLLAGRTGKVVIIEPDARSVKELRSMLDRSGLANTLVVEKAAWSETTLLRLYVDDAHPASNFSDGAKNYSDQRMQQYHSVQVEADSIDNILRELQIGQVDLVSVTTNGAEREILEGLEETIRGGLPYISLANTGVINEADMARLGYRIYCWDDRGQTFVRRDPA
jgi:FkbM family methyltransferase